jgi:hypothetical protein
LPVTALTPALVHRHVETGQIYSTGKRRYIRIIRIDRRVNIDPPSVQAHRCTVAGELLSGRHKSGPLAGSPFHEFTVALTWRDGAWRMPAGYALEA